MAVVLPAPFGPRNPATSADRDDQVEPVEGTDPAEGLRELLDLDGRAQLILVSLMVRGAPAWGG